MGMLNNPIYRVKIHREKDKDGQDMIWFEHPTQGSNPGGWMTDAAGSLLALNTAMLLQRFVTRSSRAEKQRI